jgi:hypothetical protein
VNDSGRSPLKSKEECTAGPVGEPSGLITLYTGITTHYLQIRRHQHMRYSDLCIPVLLCIGVIIAFAPCNADEGLIGGDQGYYLVHCNVDGALVYMDNVYKGTIQQGALSVPVYVTGTPYTSFRVVKEGYSYYNGPIYSVPAAGETIDLFATLDALPVYTAGTLTILSSPAGPDVYLNGNLSGKVPPSGVYTRSLPAGSYSIELHLDGYEPFIKEVYVGSDSMMKVSATLNPYTSGTLAITSVPPGAQIMVDNLFRGVSPLTLTDLSPGSHMIMLQSAGYQQYQQQIDVVAGTQMTMNAGLEPVPTPAPTKAAPVPAGPFFALLALGLLYICRSR